MLRWAHAMMRAVSRLAAVALVLVAALGCGGAGFDVRAVAKTCGLACAADELRYRLATSPRDRDLYVALAEIELERGRPGAALVALEAAAFAGADVLRLGAPHLARDERGMAGTAALFDEPGVMVSYLAADRTPPPFADGANGQEP